MRGFAIAAVATALLLGTGGGAAVVVDPFPPIGQGASVALSLFTALPATGPAAPRTGADGLQGLGDGSGRIFVNDTRGVLYVTNRAGAAPTSYLDLRTQGVGFSNAAQTVQTGLMGFAFHPNFNKDRAKPGYDLFYTIDTTLPAAGTATWSLGEGPVSHHNVVREWRVADPAAPGASVVAQRELMRVAQPFGDHGAGTIGFNPAATAVDGDYGKLYIGLGDGGGANDPLDTAQDLTAPFGKILRIDPADPDGAGPLAYSVPADNPFVGRGDARGEVWAYGLRNPQQFGWDASGQMLISDIGQARIEEVNVGVAGANYGWPDREGSFARGTSKSDFNIYDLPADSGLFTDPLTQYDHEEIGRDRVNRLAGIGGAVRYAGSAVPFLLGKVVLADLVSGRMFYFDPAASADAAPLELGLTYGGLATSFRALEGYNNRVDLRLATDAEGELYFITKANGAIYRLAAAAAIPEPGVWAMLVAGFALVGAAARRRRFAAT